MDLQSLPKQKNGWTRRVLVACLMSWLAISCGSSDSPDLELCEAGQERECKCLGDLEGSQTCMDDGSAWEACECACVPACEDRVCGPDGCGDTCAPGCLADETCNETTGRCEVICTPECSGKCCGDDGCEGLCSDACHETGEVCDTSRCQCGPPCQPEDCATLSMKCGGPYDDGCGDELFCGDCGSNEHCTPEGRCASNCEYAVCGDICCGRGEACCAGSCTPDRCLIEGECILAGRLHPTDPCWVCLPAENASAWTYDHDNVTCDIPAYYWEGVSRQMPLTPLGRVVAVSRHNCYHHPSGGDTSSSSLSKTLQLIWEAQSLGADLIELDVVQSGTEVFLSHEDNEATNGAHFQDVLADDALSTGDQILFIEMKDLAPNETFVRDVLTAIQQQGYANPGRPVILRSFYDTRASLLFARDMLATLEFEALRPYIRLHVIHGGNQGGSTAGSQDLMIESRDNGFHGIEINYWDHNLFGKILFARSLNMDTAVWTMPLLTGEVFISALREDVDTLAVEYPVDKARYVVQESNLLAYLNVWDQGESTDTIEYHRTGTETFEAAINSAGLPTLSTLGAGHNRFGTALVFNSSQQQALTLYDADNRPSDGFLVSAVVEFDDLSLNEGETLAILNKADSGAFALELSNPPDRPTVLRFGVFVNGYHYASLPASLLNGEDNYLIIGSYDGDGSVRLWVNNSSNAVVTSSASGGGAQNNSPMILGADPQGTSGQAYFFNGKIQQATVLSRASDKVRNCREPNSLSERITARDNRRQR